MRKFFFSTLLFFVFAAGCDEQAPDTDTPHPRLITYSPAITQMVFDMGLGDHVVGITKFCRLPEGQSRPVVGDNLNIRIEPILSVQPDLILSPPSWERSYFGIFSSG